MMMTRNEEQAVAQRLWEAVSIDMLDETEGTIYLSDLASDLTGTTQFFRDTNMYLDALEAAGKSQARVIYEGGCSIGASTYSMGILAQDRGYHRVAIQGQDLSASFLSIAAQAIYPKEMIVAAVRTGHGHMFEIFGQDYVRVRDIFRQNVTILPPRSLLDTHTPEVKADVSMTANTLMHLGSCKRAALRNLAAFTRAAIVCDETGLDDVPAGFAVDARKGGYQILRRA